MNKYKIRCYWTSTAMVDIEAESLDDAIDIVSSTSFPLPKDDVSYVEDSFEVLEEDSWQEEGRADGMESEDVEVEEDLLEEWRTTTPYRATSKHKNGFSGGGRVAYFFTERSMKNFLAIEGQGQGWFLPATKNSFWEKL
jgi:hypothetical protein